MMQTVNSKNGVPIRLPDERWTHISDEHGELADRRQQVLGTIAQPERILAGGARGNSWPCAKSNPASAWSSPIGS